jgi:hypothetical protein
VPKKHCVELSEAREAAAFREDLRAAREVCGRDVEAFDQLLFAIERLGSRLAGHTGTLGSYQKCLSKLAQKSSLVAGSAGDSDEGLPYFPSLFSTMVAERNSALHQGAVARHLTSRLIEVSLILEDALTIELGQVQYLMVKNIVVANSWQTLAAIRQVMLANAFSYLPLCWEGKWHFISDHALASHLRRAKNPKGELARPIADVLKTDTKMQGALIDAKTCPMEKPAHETVGLMECGVPVLVTSRSGSHVIGLISPADLL